MLGADVLMLVDVGGEHGFFHGSFGVVGEARGTGGFRLFVGRRSRCRLLAGDGQTQVLGVELALAQDFPADAAALQQQGQQEIFGADDVRAVFGGQGVGLGQGVLEVTGEFFQDVAHRIGN